MQQSCVLIGFWGVGECAPREARVREKGETVHYPAGHSSSGEPGCMATGDPVEPPLLGTGWGGGGGGRGGAREDK